MRSSILVIIFMGLCVGLFTCTSAPEVPHGEEPEDTRTPCKREYDKGMLHAYVAYDFLKDGERRNAALMYRNAAYYFSTAVVECEDGPTRRDARDRAQTSINNIYRSLEGTFIQ